MKNEKVIYSTSNAFIANLYRIVCVGSIIILIINFYANPTAFTIILVLLIIVLLLTITKSIVIKNKHFEIRSCRLLSAFNRASIFTYNDIKEIRCKTGWLYKSVMLIPFLDYFFAIDMEVITKDEKTFSFNLEGLRWKDVKKCIQLINEQRLFE